MTDVMVNECPHCGEITDRATNLTGEQSVRVGDVSVCLYCHKVSVFDEDLRLTKAPEHVLLEPNVLRVVEMVKAIANPPVPPSVRAACPYCRHAATSEGLACREHG